MSPGEKPGIRMQLETLLFRMHFKRFFVKSVPVSFLHIIWRRHETVFLQGVQANELREFRRSFYFLEKVRSEFGAVSVAIMCYRGALPNPQWLDHDEGKFIVISVVAFRIDFFRVILEALYRPF